VLSVGIREDDECVERVEEIISVSPWTTYGICTDFVQTIRTYSFTVLTSPTYSLNARPLVIHVGLARTVYIHRVFGGIPAKSTAYTPYRYGSGQLYVYGLANLFVHYLCLCMTTTN
jgi:hypothetical protein